MAEEFELGEAPAEESSNRTFTILAVGLVSMLVVSLLCLGLYAFFFAPQQQRAREAEQTRAAEETLAAQLQVTPTPTDTPVPTETPRPTATLVTPTPDLALTETASAQQTAAASAPTRVPTPTATPETLPNTGFADDVGLSGLMLFGVLLVVAVIVARQVRIKLSDS
jgi:cytoskeletal protein RodZ